MTTIKSCSNKEIQFISFFSILYRLFVIRFVVVVVGVVDRSEIENENDQKLDISDE